MSVLDYPPPFVEPAYLWVPPGRRGTYGPEVVDFTNSIGHPVDAEQEQAIDALASYGPGGDYLTLESLVLEGRQNGKTDRTVLPLTLADLFLFGVERITWTAQLMDTCRDVFETVKRLIEANASLSRRVKEINEAKSEESIVLMSGAEMEFRARSGKGGRGKGGTIWVADEWLFGTSAELAARLPTLSARKNPQVRYLSSAGLAESVHLQTLVERGRAGNDPSLIFIERCAPGGFDDPGCANEKCTHAVGSEGCTLDREELLHLANHAAGRRISYAFMRNERRTLPVLEYARERFGWHELGIGAAARPIRPEDWAATTVPADAPRPTGRPAFFVDISPDLASASIGVAADREDGLPHAELPGHQLGTDWLVARAKQLHAAHPDAKWGATAYGGVGMVVPKLKALGIELELLTEQEMARACVHMQALTTEPYTFTHAEDPDLTAAVAGAVKKDIGDGLWVLTRKNLSVDLSPLYVQVGACWLLEKHRGIDPLDNIY